MSHEINKALRVVKYNVHRYPEIKAKTKDATNTDPWGPTSQQKQLLAEACFNEEDKELIMKALWKRITKADKAVQVTKALDCLEFILIHGPTVVLTEMRERRGTLVDAAHVEGAQRRVDRLLELIDNPPAVQQEREKAERVRLRMTETERTRSSEAASYDERPPGDLYPPAPSAEEATERRRSSTAATRLVSPQPVTSAQQQQNAASSVEHHHQPQVPATLPKPPSQHQHRTSSPPPPQATSAATNSAALDDIFAQPIATSGVAPPPMATAGVPATQDALFGTAAPFATAAPPPPHSTGNAPAVPAHTPPPHHSPPPITSGGPGTKALVDLDNLMVPQRDTKDHRSLNAMRADARF